MDNFFAMFHGLDKQIDEFVAPTLDKISDFIFYPLIINGVEVPVIIVWLLLASVVFTVITRGISLWGFKHALDIITGKYDKKYDHNKESGEVSSFQALATALSGTIGLGNIAGVAVAITMGGPGAVLWMMVGAFFGMTSKFMEATLGVKYRRINPDGSVSGGPMHYISHGLTRMKLRWLGQPLAIMFSWMCIAEAFGGGNMFQINMATAQIIEITKDYTPFFANNSWVVGLVMAIVIAMIIIGGIKSIASVASKVVPLMCVIYLASGLFVIAVHFTQIPEVIGIIFNEAFNPKAVEGGIIGCIIWGMKRSIQSNEAGVGSAPIAYAAVKTKEPISQGFVSLLEPFIDTVLVCSITAFVIIVTGAYHNADGLAGAELTSAAFKTVIPFFPYVLALVIIMFALSTLISWSYYGLKCWNFLFGEGLKRTRTFQVIFCIFIVIGSSMNMESVIYFTDAMLFAMAVPNLIAIYLMAPQVLRDLKSYCERYNIGIYRVVMPETVEVEEEEPIIETKT